MDCDVKLSGGQVIDGTGSAAVRADVALRGDRIVAPRRATSPRRDTPRRSTCLTLRHL